MACVDIPEHKKDTAKEVASCIRAGFVIEKMKAEDVRTAKWCDNCGKCAKKRPAIRKSLK